MGSFDNRFPDTGKNNDFVRVDMFHPSSLTEEEASVLKQLRYESAWKRGYPFALLGGATTALLTQRFSMIARVSLTAFSAVIGNVAGRVSYIPTIHQRLLTDLSPESPLRQKLEQAKTTGRQVFLQDDSKENDFVQFEDNSTPYDPSEGSTNSTPESSPPLKKYVSYEELRQQNRKRLQEHRAMPPGGEEMPRTDYELVAPARDGNKPRIKKRYNKYGDEIVE